MLVKISLAFARISDSELVTFALGVHEALTGNAAFASPPVALANLQTAIDDFTAKLAAAQIGGPMDTAAKNNSRQTLLGVLRPLASYVQLNCNNDTVVLLSSGFQMQSANRASTPLAQPQSLSLKNGAAGQLVASIAPVRNVNMYEGRIKPSDGDWLPSVFTGDSQHITFSGLTPGKNYTAQVRALGGQTGQSDWSDPSSHMAM